MGIKHPLDKCLPFFWCFLGSQLSSAFQSWNRSPWWLWAPLRGPLVPFWKPYRATAVNSWCASCASSWKWHRLRAYLFFDQAVPCCTLPSSLEVVLLAWMIVGTLQLSGFKHEFTRSGWSPPRVDATSLHTTYTFTWSLVMAWTKHTCRAYFTQQFHIQ